MARFPQNTVARVLLDRFSTDATTEETVGRRSAVEDAVREGVLEGFREYEHDVLDGGDRDSGSSGRTVTPGRLLAGTAGLAGTAYLVRRRRKRGGDAGEEPARRQTGVTPERD